MTTANHRSHDSGESATRIMKAAEKADEALRDTAERYLNRRGFDIDLRRIENSIRERPLSSAAIAAGAGFIVGGGLATRPGIAILVLFARIAVREAAFDFVTGMMMPRRR
jgi:ElaB/YqjD/DUF883 family membrane-anchored ribosome-binding protein